MYHSLNRTNSLLLENIAREEEEECKDRDYWLLADPTESRHVKRTNSGGYCDRNLTTCQEHSEGSGSCICHQYQSYGQLQLLAPRFVYYGPLARRGSVRLSDFAAIR